MSRHPAWGPQSATAITVLLLISLWSPLTSGPALAHDRKDVGEFRLVIGWGDEPAFTGSKNAVEVDVADMAGRPVVDLEGALSVDVTFGDEKVTLPLGPARGHPGRFRALLLPTRAGTYTFHITGTVKGHIIDATSTCSDKTFGCVRDVSEIQFPVKDPSAGQVADRISRELPRAEAALETAADAPKWSVAALAGALLALVAAIGFGSRNRKTGA